ncbi:MAG: flagellar biosynthesis protein FlgD [Alphaproteobacteria bacterium]|nr:flagellar biosynthesis protein FlgD [Alphaproteobacteria bacterium]
MTTAASAMPATVTALPPGTQLPTNANGLTSTGQTLSQNAFLQLLTAQLEHQDPLDPTSADAFASELAEFSTATGVQNLETSATGQQAVGLVGQKVAVSGNSLILGQGGATGAFNLSSAASNVAVTIANAAGTTVAQLNLGAMPAGTQTFSWSGGGANGTTLAPGTYNFSLTAIGAQGAAVAATPYAVAPVTGVALGGQSGPTLDLGGGLAPVPLSSVQQVF